MIKTLAYESWSSPNGKIVGVRDSQGKVKMATSSAELLEFLRYSAKGVVRVTWDLDEFIAPVLRLLPIPVLKRLSEFDGNLDYCGHQLYYLPDRMLRIGRARFYGIRQFWTTKEPTPATLEEVQDKADELVETLAAMGMPDPIGLTSPISVFEKTELGQDAYAGIPKGYEIPPNNYPALQFASYADRREWVSAYQVGHWSEGEIWDYDISACYSSIAAELLDLRQFRFWNSTTMNTRNRNAYYGVLKGHLVLDPKAEYIHCSPLVASVGRLPGNPAGDFGEGYHITLDELRFLERYNLGEFQMSEGWFMTPHSSVQPGKPFRDLMHRLYGLRQRSELASSIAKGIANQIVGKLIETRVDGEYGQLRNDLYHTLVLAKARIKVAEFLIQNDIKVDELVVVQTDGCRLTRKIHLTGNGLGAWRCNGSSPTIVASPYKVYVDDKKPGHLTYEHITRLISEHPKSRYYARTVEHRTTLRQALQQDDISLVGQLVHLPAHLDLIAVAREQNRLFTKLPQTGQALLGNKFSSLSSLLP